MQIYAFAECNRSESKAGFRWTVSGPWQRGSARERQGNEGGHRKDHVWESLIIVGPSLFYLVVAGCSIDY